MADAAAVPLWFVAREASKHVKVVLSGEGSDELFGGYAIYHQPGVVRAGERLPGWGRAPMKRAAAMIPSGVKGRGFLERTSTPLRHRYIGNARVFSESEVALHRGPARPTRQPVGCHRPGLRPGGARRTSTTCPPCNWWTSTPGWPATSWSRRTG